MDTALIILFLLVSSLFSFPAFYKGTGIRTKGAHTAAKVLGAVYILTHLLIAGASLAQLDSSSGEILAGLNLVSISYVTIILFAGFEALALAYAVVYFIRTKKNATIRVFSAVTAGVSIFIGVAYTVVLLLFAGDYIDWTCVFFCIPYLVYASVLFIIKKQNEPLPEPKKAIRQIIPKDKLKKNKK